MAQEQKTQCPDFPYFGARYPDATCIDGYLWDLDKCEDGKLYGGGDEPCPFCNTDSFIEQHIDEETGFTKEKIIEQINILKEKYS